ncbi:MAG: hypothetical protein KF723_06550 [Rhizobiaceae bacterium]|nr:hypothetical protein [Rhizobiaceae bacterium]
MADWLEILKEQRKEGQRMGRDVPRMLANPAITSDQAKTLFDAMERQAVFVETLRKVLEANNYEPDVVKAAEGLEELYADLAATVAEKVRALMA